jgi:hypothetical protein
LETVTKRGVAQFRVLRIPSDEFSRIRSDHQVLDINRDGSLEGSSRSLHVNPISPLDGDAVRGVVHGKADHRGKTEGRPVPVLWVTDGRHRAIRETAFPLQISKKPDLRFVVGSQFFNQNPINAEEGRGTIFPSRIKVKRRDGDGVGSGADRRVVVGQVRVPNGVEGVSDLRFGDLGRVRGLGEREGDEKGEGKQAKGQTDRVSPRERASLWRWLLPSQLPLSSSSLSPPNAGLVGTVMMPQRKWDVKRGKGVRTRQCEGRKAWECHACR